ncbi:hypothetical protein vseg_012639 [Gypsophila vaccaria]
MAAKLFLCCLGSGRQGHPLLALLLPVRSRPPLFGSLKSCHSKQARIVLADCQSSATHPCQVTVEVCINSQHYVSC